MVNKSLFRGRSERVERREKGMSFAIGIDHPKNVDNLGTLWRSAYNFNAGMIFTINCRYKPQSSDTQKTYRHVPLINYEDHSTFFESIPYSWEPIIVELCHEAEPLKKFIHPRSAVYILGAEDHGVGKEILSKPYKRIFIEAHKEQSLNVAVAGSIIMYDRFVKRGGKK